MRGRDESDDVPGSAPPLTRDGFLQRVRSFRTPLRDVGRPDAPGRTRRSRPRAHSSEALAAVRLVPCALDSEGEATTNLAFSHQTMQCSSCGRVRRWEEASEEVTLHDPGTPKSAVPPSAYLPTKSDHCGPQVWRCRGCGHKNAGNRRIPVESPTRREALWAVENARAEAENNRLRELLADFLPEHTAARLRPSQRPKTPAELPPVQAVARSQPLASPSSHRVSAEPWRPSTGGKGWSPTPLTARGAFIEKCEQLSLVPLARLHHAGAVALAHYRIGDSTAVAFAEMLEHSDEVVSLDLRDNAIRAKGAAAVCAALRNKPELRLLDLSDNRIEKRGANAVADMLESLSAGLTATSPDAEPSLLGTLRVARNSLSDAAARLMLSALTHTPRLQTLDLSHNSLGVTRDGAATLAAAVASVPGLEVLKLQWNLVNGRGAEMLTGVLNSHAELRVLDLGFNNLGEQGGIAIGNMLQFNTSLTDLQLQHNHITPNGSLAICEGLRHNNERAAAINEEHHSGTNRASKIDTLRLSSLCQQPLSVGMQGNPIGKLGGRALIKIANGCGRALKINLSDCDFSPNDPDSFDPKHCAGIWVLHLDHPYEHAIAQELLRISRENARIDIGDGLGAHDSDGTDSDTEDEDFDDNDSLSEDDEVDDVSDSQSGPNTPKTPTLPMAPGLFLTEMAQKQKRQNDRKEIQRGTKISASRVTPLPLTSNAVRNKENSSKHAWEKSSSSTRLSAIEDLKRQIAHHRGEVTHMQHRKIGRRQSLRSLAAGKVPESNMRKTSSSRQMLKMANANSRRTMVSNARISSVSMNRRRSNAFVLPTFTRMYESERWCWSSVKLDGIAVKDDARAYNWVLPEHGLLELDMTEPSKWSHGLGDALHDRNFARLFRALDTQESHDKGDDHILKVIVRACDDTFFTAQQAKVLCRMLDSVAARVSALRSLFGRIVDLTKRDSVFEVIENKVALAKLQINLGDFIGMNIDNAIGYYSLDLARPEQHEIAIRLFELNAEEVRKRKKRRGGHLVDLSQHGNWCAFRNLTFVPAEGQSLRELPRAISDWAPTMTRDKAKPIHFMFDPDWKIPKQGTLELDFVIWKRPPKYAFQHALRADLPHEHSDDSESDNDSDGEGGSNPQLEEKDSDGRTKTGVFRGRISRLLASLDEIEFAEQRLLWLRIVSSTFYLTASQAFDVADSVANADFWALHQRSIPAYARDAYRVEVLVMLFPRVVDLDAFVALSWAAKIPNRGVMHLDYLDLFEQDVEAATEHSTGGEEKATSKTPMPRSVAQNRAALKQEVLVGTPPPNTVASLPDGTSTLHHADSVLASHKGTWLDEQLKLIIRRYTREHLHELPHKHIRKYRKTQKRKKTMLRARRSTIMLKQRSGGSVVLPSFDALKLGGILEGEEEGEEEGGNAGEEELSGSALLDVDDADDIEDDDDDEFVEAPRRESQCGEIDAELLAMITGPGAESDEEEEEEEEPKHEHLIPHQSVDPSELEGQDVLSVKQRLLITVMFQVIDIDNGDAISLDEVIKFNPPESVLEFFTRSVESAGAYSDEGIITAREWEHLWEALVEEMGDIVLDNFIANFNIRAREIVGDAEFDFIAHALEQAEEEEEVIEAAEYKPSRGSFVLYHDEDNHLL